MLTSTELFDERYYLSTNPDVATAVSSGFFSSGFTHFNEFGQFERRNPSAYFDTNFYLQQNQDVANAVNARQTTAFAHFINNGQFERRNPNVLFDTNYYLQQYQDVATAVAGDRLTGIEHFVEFGDFEGRASSRFFDAGFYLNQNPDVAQAVQQRTIGAEEHFIEFGQLEGRIPRRLFSQLYVFGDSLSDDGNLFALTGGLVPPSPPYFNGRFTNGPVWVELLAPRLGLQVNPDTNFAFGGATSGTQNTGNIPNFPPLPGLQQEIDNFVAASPAVDPNGLYTVYAGANDYLGAGTTDFVTVVNNIATAVTKLANAGARNFMLPNLPNLSIAPGASDREPFLQQLLAQISNAHNIALASTAQNLEQNPNINVIYVDVGALFNNAIANPANFGFTNISTNLVPGAGTDPNVRNFTLPAGVNPDQYLFWDLIHPTARAHQLVADTALKATTALPEVVRIL